MQVTFYDRLRMATCDILHNYNNIIASFQSQRVQLAAYMATLIYQYVVGRPFNVLWIAHAIIIIIIHTSRTQ